MKHPLFFSRTVLVKENNVEEAIRILNRVLGRENIFQEARRIQRYEKPTVTRRRINNERINCILKEDMDRRINFLSRKFRRNPFPGC